MSLAQRLDGEVLSCDSMQVYRGMDIGTAKPPMDVREGIPHHLFDILEIHEPYDANQFVLRARQVLEGIRGRGRVPILAGGTGLYARALVYGMRMLPADRATLRQVEQQYEQPGGRDRLLAELRRASPSLGEIPLANPRRIIRAVEVLRLSGLPPWEHPRHEESEPLPGFRQFVLTPPGADCHHRWIAERTARMLRSGWLEETRGLVARGLLHTPTARQALGYDVIAQFLQHEARALDVLLEVLVAKTCQYAKRQRTWFRHQHPGAQVVPLPDASPSREVVSDVGERIVHFLANASTE